MRQTCFALLICLMAIGFASCSNGGGDSDNADTAIEDSGTAVEESENTAIVRPEGWSEKTHGKDAEPDYDVVFSENTVKRIDLTITPETWQAMLDDMTDLYGEFGSREGMPGMDDNVERPEGFEPPEGFAPPEGLEIPEDFVPPGGELPEEGELPEGAFPGGQRPGGDMGGMFNNDTANPMWAPCTFKFEGKIWNYAGVRFKGNSSLMSTWGGGNYKLPFRFDFDEFKDDHPEIDDQRFYGFKKLSLSSNWSDDSLLREKVTADIFRDVGVPAPRTAFYRLYIDFGEGSQYFGLYTMVEIPDDPMLESQFMDSSGNLYKPEGTGASFASFDEDSFDKETNEDEGDFSDVRALYDALQGSRENPEEWRRNLEAVFNVDGFLRWLAVNTLIQNWDTYGNMAHNYYLYNDPGDGLIHWIPWDNNMALDSSGMRGRTLSLALTGEEVGDQWPLIRYLADDAVYWAKYRTFVEETVANTFTPERMQPIYAAARELIRPYVTGEEGEQEGFTHLSSPEAFDEAHAYLNVHVEERYNEALLFLDDSESAGR